MDTEKFLTTKFDELSMKTQTAVEWIENHHNEDIVEIGRCNCHRAGDKTAYAWIQNLPDSIEVGCSSKSHKWKDVVLVEELERIGPKAKDRTAMKHLRSTLQWWKIHRIASSIEPYTEPFEPDTLETTIFDIPDSKAPNNDSGSSQFAITSGSQSKRRPRSSTQVNVATLVQVLTIAYRVNYFGKKYFEQKVRKAWQEKDPIPLIQAMIPFIDMVPGFAWFTTWLNAYGGDHIFATMLVEVLKQTFADTFPDTEGLSLDPAVTSPVVVASAQNATAASPVAFPQVGALLGVADDKYRAARDAFNKRMFDKNKKGLLGGSAEGC
ncbi:hypothetical protein KCU95_g3193, partial [Aureobasidium melanogenum]